MDFSSRGTELENRLVRASIQTRSCEVKFEKHTRNPMKRRLEFNPSRSTDTTEVGFNQLFPARQTQAHRRESKLVPVSGLFFAILFAVAFFVAPSAASAGEVSIGISLRVGPPPIPVYTQPVCPGPGFMWTPGYWAFDPDQGYYWVPGTWVEVPEPGMYWTPGYWGWGGSVFVWHPGYWGPHVGFYGGIDYGFGYNGFGFVGGEWRGREFYYNRSVNNIGRGHFDHVYYRSVPNHYSEHRVSYNGGEGGVNARPRREEIAAEHDRHAPATTVQQHHQTAARGDRSQFVSVNHGMPGVAATGRPGELRGNGAVRPVRAGGTANPAASRGGVPEHNTGYSGPHNPNPGAGGARRSTATGPVNPGGNHPSNSNHPTGYSGYHYPSPSGGSQAHQPAGGTINPGGNHGTNPDRNAGYSGNHNPSASGGLGTRQPSSNYGHGPASSVPGSPAPGSMQRGMARGQFHPTLPPVQNAPSSPPPSNNRSYSHPGNNGPAGGPPANHGGSPHQEQAQPHSPPPSGGGHPGHEPDHHH
jgi:hypothetical protein